MKKLIDRTTVRYVEIGVLNMLFCTAIMYLLYNLTRLSSWACAFINHALGGVISYSCNRRFVFREKKRSPKTLALFVLNLAVCYVISYSIVLPGMKRLLAHWTHRSRDNLAMGAGVLLFSVLNYFGERFVVFREA